MSTNFQLVAASGFLLVDGTKAFSMAGSDAGGWEEISSAKVAVPAGQHPLNPPKEMYPDTPSPLQASWNSGQARKVQESCNHRRNKMVPEAGQDLWFARVGSLLVQTNPATRILVTLGLAPLQPGESATTKVTCVGDERWGYGCSCPVGFVELKLIRCCERPCDLSNV